MAAASAVASRYGFTEAMSVVDRPAEHQVRFINPTDGAYASFGTSVNAVLGGITGCNLPDAARDSPAPTTR